MISFLAVQPGDVFTVSDFPMKYRKVSDEEMRLHGLPPGSWLSRRRLKPVPGLQVRLVDEATEHEPTTRVVEDSAVTEEKRKIPRKPKAPRRRIPRRRN